MALSLVLALTLVLALVRNIIFSKVRVLVLNQPIMERLARFFKAAIGIATAAEGMNSDLCISGG